MPGAKRRISAIHLIPVLLACIMGSGSGYILLASGVSEELGSPFIMEESPRATALNTVSFLALLALGSLLVYVIYRYVKQLLVLLLASSLALSSAFVYWAHLVALARVAALYSWIEALSPHLSAILSLATLFAALKLHRSLVASLALLTFGALTGGMLSFMLPSWSILAVLCAASAFDIYSVFRGPISRMIKISHGEGSGVPGEFKLVIVEFKGLGLGLGDVIFYSMLSSLSLIHPHISLLRWLVVTLAVLAGAYTTFKLLERRPLLPALPLPALSGVAAYLVLVGF